jgi:hypothetical protein
MITTKIEIRWFSILLSTTRSDPVENLVFDSYDSLDLAAIPADTLLIWLQMPVFPQKQGRRYEQDNNK